MDPKIALFRISGLCAANFQAFAADGSVDVSVVPAHAANLRAQRVGSVFACGTTGEGSKLTVAERKTMLEAWIAAAGTDLKVIAHVGAESLGDARDLAAHAASVGAAAIGIIPPCYIKPSDVNAAVAWVEAVASACPALPVYYCAWRVAEQGGGGQPACARAPPPRALSQAARSAAARHSASPRHRTARAPPPPPQTTSRP